MLLNCLTGLHPCWDFGLVSFFPFPGFIRILGRSVFRAFWRFILVSRQSVNSNVLFIQKAYYFSIRFINIQLVKIKINYTIILSQNIIIINNIIIKKYFKFNNFIKLFVISKKHSNLLIITLINN